MKPTTSALFGVIIIVGYLCAYSQEMDTETKSLRSKENFSITPERLRQLEEAGKAEKEFLSTVMNNPKLLKRLETEREFVSAAAGGDLVRLRSMLDSGVNINAMEVNFGWTALTVAADRGRLETVKFLLNNGADINATAAGDNTALFWAVYEGRQEVVKFLLEQGASHAHKGESLLETAKTEGHQQVIDILREHGIN